LCGWLKCARHLLHSADKELILDHLYRLKRVLEEEGIAVFFIRFMEAEWEGKSTAERILARLDGAVFLRDLQKIVQILAQEEGDIDALLLLLKRFERLRLEGDKRLEIEAEMGADAVRILTIHTSKGLEFSRVFALGIINRTQIDEGLVAVENALVPMTSKDPGWNDHVKEVEAEKFRQLYVALTRAKNKLYLPVLMQSDRKKAAKEGTESPMELFLEAAGVSNIQKAEELFSACRFTVVEQEVGTVVPYEEKEAVEIYPPKAVETRGTERFVCSFTSLTKGLTGGEWELTPPANFNCEEKSIHTLPAGIKTGLLFHRLMEELCFERAQDAEYLFTYVSKQVQGTLFEEWKEVLVQTIQELMQMEFLECGGRLADVNPQCILREANFFYPSQDSNFVKGIADFIFLYEDKYYLLDWKTNWLGNSYTPEILERAMHHHHYFLQADLYVKALKRYLTLVDGRPFDQIFGGVYYLFIRGMEKGVYRV